MGFKLSGAMTLDSTRRRKRSANTSPSALPVSGSMKANSSPPTRHGTSPSREAELVVELLEAIDVDHQQAERVPEPGGSADFLPEPQVEVPSVADFRELVGMRHLAEPEVGQAELLHDAVGPRPARPQALQLVIETPLHVPEHVTVDHVEAGHLETRQERQ